MLPHPLYVPDPSPSSWKNFTLNERVIETLNNYFEELEETH